MHSFAALPLTTGSDILQDGKQRWRQSNSMKPVTLAHLMIEDDSEVAAILIVCHMLVMRGLTLASPTLSHKLIGMENILPFFVMTGKYNNFLSRADPCSEKNNKPK